jgi:hypothetical protein
LPGSGIPDNLKSTLRGDSLPAILPPLFTGLALAETRKSPQAALSGRERLMAALLAFGLLGLLAVAVALKPNPRGLGTHQQLGFPPCTFRVVLGFPCPTCGMTTAWAHLVRGQLFDAFRANVGGALSGMLAMATTPWLILSAARGRWLGVAFNRLVAAWTAVAVGLATLVQWGLRMWAP